MKPSTSLRWPAIGLLLLLSLTACSGSDDSAWLIGRWAVAYNPSLDDNDQLVFLAEQRMRIEMADGRKIDGEYQVRGNDLTLHLAVPKRPTEVHFRISPDHQRLIFKNGAYYQRR